MNPTLHHADGTPVKIGDTVTNHRGESSKVTHIELPHKPSAAGRICTDDGSYCYVTVYNLTWHGRTDR